MATATAEEALHPTKRKCKFPALDTASNAWRAPTFKRHF